MLRKTRMLLEMFLEAPCFQDFDIRAANIYQLIQSVNTTGLSKH